MNIIHIDDFFLNCHLINKFCLTYVLRKKIYFFFNLGGGVVSFLLAETQEWLMYEQLLFLASTQSIKNNNKSTKNLGVIKFTPITT